MSRNIPDPDHDAGHPFINQSFKQRSQPWSASVKQWKHPKVVLLTAACLLAFFFYLANPSWFHSCPARPPSPSPEVLINPSADQTASQTIKYPKNIIVTGGAGYIASHFALRLFQSEQPYSIHLVDDLSRGNRYNVDTLTKLTRPGWSVKFHHHDCGDSNFMADLMASEKIELVVHFAGNAYAFESVLHPLSYFDNIVTKTQGLLNAMERAGVKRLLYSSSSATYGQPLDEICDVPIAENSPQVPVSPYGRSKLMAEQVIDAFAISQNKSNKEFGYALLRYFNVIGADEKTRIGPLPRQDLKQFSRVVDGCFDAAVEDKEMSIFGSDYATPDGTAIRDYIHVWDLVEAHLAVIKAVHSNQRLAYNVGIGHGFSNKQLVEACAKATGKDLRVAYKPRREGDPALVLGDASKIKRELNWVPQYTDLTEMIRTAWLWRQKADANNWRKERDESPSAELKKGL